MVPSLYEHQKRIIDEDKKKCGLFLGTGASKTRIALEMSEGSTLVICPKQQRDDKTWQNNAEKFDIVINLTVISKEDLRRDWDILPYYDTVIIDEAHYNFGVLPDTRQRKGVQIPKTSQIFDATINFLKKHPPKRLYLCTATPVSKPMNLWAIAKILGHDWDFFRFRSTFYSEVRMGGRRVWVPRKNETFKQKLVDLVKSFGYTGSLNDFFDVPEQTHKTVEIELTAQQKQALKDLSLNEADPMVRRAKARTIENGILYCKKVVEISEREEKMVNDVKIYDSAKVDYILERAQEFPKLLIFANYKAQIYEIERRLKKDGYNVSTLTGDTKDRSFIKKVDESTDPHIIIAQSSICSGYELPTFPCVIYASKSWQFVNYEQSLGRVLRSNHLKKNLYIHLVVKDGPDEDCHKSILSGSDFQEKIMENIE